jgi:hypothetical protein
VTRTAARVGRLWFACSWRAFLAPAGTIARCFGIAFFALAAARRTQSDLRSLPPQRRPRLEAPTSDELATALALGDRHPDSGVGLPGVTVMAMSRHRRVQTLTRGFRRVRSVVLRRGHHWPLLVAEHELPRP